MEGFVMTWWIWFLVGLALLLTEFLTLALGLVELAGIQFPLSVQLLLFLVLSFGSLILLRKPLRLKLEGKNAEVEVDQLEGETAVALEEIAVNGFGKAELRGTAWNARNVGDTPIAESQRCRVERVDGLTLWVRL